MTDTVVHELVTVTADEAGRLEQEFLNGLDQAQDAFVQIMETNAWAALGHASFVAWWSARVVPVMRALSMRPTLEIAKAAIEQARNEEAQLPPAQRRTNTELADMFGASDWTVRGRQDQRGRRSAAEGDLDAEPDKSQPEATPPDGLSETLGCESCGGELDPENAQVGYLRCEGCDSEGEHVASTFPDGADGLCVVCNPDDPQVQAWLESTRPENVFGKYYSPEKHGTGDTPEPPQPDGREQPPQMSKAERRAHEESVRRAQDIAAAHRASDSIVHDLRVAMVTIVTGCRYGETGLVTKQMVADLRQIVDQLEGEL